MIYEINTTEGYLRSDGNDTHVERHVHCRPEAGTAVRHDSPLQLFCDVEDTGMYQ